MLKAALVDFLLMLEHGLKARLVEPALTKAAWINILVCWGLKAALAEAALIEFLFFWRLESSLLETTPTGFLIILRLKTSLLKAALAKAGL